MQFRKDINGLRAWAVIAVILYHFGIQGFNNGYLGVDIFFVISGFLMTKIIILSLSNNNFSYSKFIASRATRIVPTLICVVICLLLFTWYFLPAAIYRLLATHAITALLFISNIVFWRESGYFDASAYEKVLLHTWSLSVEWQFYLLLPIFLIFLWAFNKRQKKFNLSFIFLVFTITVFSYSVYLSSQDSVAAFFSTTSRSWEMMAGGIVYLLFENKKINKITAKILEFIGFALIIFSIISFNNFIVWSPIYALLPVSGTILILIASRQQSLLTSPILLQKIGNISYSAYLWHWPFSIFLVLMGKNQDYLYITLSLLATIILSLLTYIFLEKWLKSLMNSWSPKKIFFYLGLAVTLVAICCHIIRTQLITKEDVLSSSVTVNQNIPLSNICHGATVKEVTTNCQKKLGAIVIGDSHAAAMVGSVAMVAKNYSKEVLDWSYDSCPTMFGIRGGYTGNCHEFLGTVFETQKSIDKKVPLIIINRTSAYIMGPNEPDRINEVYNPQEYIIQPHEDRDIDFRNELKESLINTACEFAKYRPVYIFRPIPELKINVPLTMNTARSFGVYRRVDITKDEYLQRNQETIGAQDIARERCNIKILDPVPYMCDDNMCYGDKEGKSLYVDDDHVGEEGRRVLAPLFVEVISKN